MKPVTEEQRQALIADCESSIERIEISIRNGGSDNPNHLISELSRQEIALASLMAERLTTLYQSTSGKQSVVGCEPLPLGRTAVYAYPPVPVIKLPNVAGGNSFGGLSLTRLSGAMPSAADLIRSEIADFCAGLSAPGEPATPEEIQRQLIDRIMPILGEEQ